MALFADLAQAEVTLFLNDGSGNSHRFTVPRDNVFIQRVDQSYNCYSGDLDIDVTLRLSRITLEMLVRQVDALAQESERATVVTEDFNREYPRSYRLSVNVGDSQGSVAIETNGTMGETNRYRNAANLLQAHCTVEQWAEYEQTGCMTVVAQSGREYIVSASDVRPKNHSWEIAWYCAYPVYAVPDGDNILAKKLMLETDENEFIRIANVFRASATLHNRGNTQTVTVRAIPYTE